MGRPHSLQGSVATYIENIISANTQQIPLIVAATVEEP